nr:Clp protease N-terminal domain-containing protein [Acidobacteriota bacterium]
MDFNRFTEKLQEGMRAAQSIASKRGQQQIDVEHLLLALLGQEGGLAQSLFAKAEVDRAPLHQKLVEELD